MKIAKWWARRRGAARTEVLRVVGWIDPEPVRYSTILVTSRVSRLRTRRAVIDLRREGYIAPAPGSRRRYQLTTAGRALAPKKAS